MSIPRFRERQRSTEPGLALAGSIIRDYVVEQALGDKVISDSHMCPGATALHLPDSNPAYPTAFMVDHEYVHVHADGSLHVAANPFTVDDIVANGWAEKHPEAGRSLPANVLLVYGPRNQSELEAVSDIVRTAFAWAADL
jgi:hypothetical protein